MGIHLLRYMHGGERMASHNVVRNAFAAIVNDARFYARSYESGPMSFHPLSYNLRIIELTLCYQLMVSTHWQMLLSQTPFELIWFHGLFFFMGLQRQL